MLGAAATSSSSSPGPSCSVLVPAVSAQAGGHGCCFSRCTFNQQRSCTCVPETQVGAHAQTVVIRHGSQSDKSVEQPRFTRDQPIYTPFCLCPLDSFLIPQELHIPPSVCGVPPTPCNILDPHLCILSLSVCLQFPDSTSIAACFLSLSHYVCLSGLWPCILVIASSLLLFITFDKVLEQIILQK